MSATRTVRVTLAAVLFAGCGAAQEPPPWTKPGLETAVRPEMGPPQPGDPAPAFTLPALDGTPVGSEDLRGSWILLHFTASWCPFCDAEVEHLGKIAHVYAERGVRVVLVDVQEDQEHWREYARANVDPRVVALWDADGSVAARYAPPGAQPSFEQRAQVLLDGTLIIDPEGRIRLFVLANSKAFDPTFRAVLNELDEMLAAADASGPSAGANRVRSPGAAKEAPALAPEQVVRVRAEPGAAVIAGGNGEARVVLDIVPGYHVMSDRPSDPLYIATRVEVAGGDDLRWEAARYPPPVSFQLLEDSISTFEGVVEVRVPFQVASDAAPGTRAATARVHYQACTATNCLFPTSRTADLTIEVAGGS